METRCLQKTSGNYIALLLSFYFYKRWKCIDNRKLSRIIWYEICFFFLIRDGNALSTENQHELNGIIIQFFIKDGNALSKENLNRIKCFHRREKRIRQMSKSQPPSGFLRKLMRYDNSKLSLLSVLLLVLRTRSCSLYVYFVSFT